MINQRLAIAISIIVTAVAAVSFAGKHAFTVAENKPATTEETRVIVIGKVEEPPQQQQQEEPKLSLKDFDCLARNVYFEAKNQSIAGQLAVALVTLNRVEDRRFPSTVCGVVTQSGMDGRNAGRSCQFSWYCDGKSNEPRRNTKAWETAVAVAQDAYRMHLNGFDVTNGATHFHATYVRPYWASSLNRVARIDDHIFYRWDNRRNA